MPIKTTVTGTVQDPSGVVASAGYVEFRISPASSSQPYRVSGTATIAPMVVRAVIDSDGEIKASDGVSDLEIWGNDLLQPANSTYQILFAPNGVVAQSINGYLINGATYNLSEPVFQPEFTLNPSSAPLRGEPIQGNLIPLAANSFNVGSASLPYAAGYFGELFADNINLANPVSSDSIALAGYTKAALPNPAGVGQMARITNLSRNVWWRGTGGWAAVDPEIDIMALGAVGDGTNDTAAIQNVLDLVAGTGITVRVPYTASGFNISATLLITAGNIKLRGEPGAKLINLNNVLVNDAMIKADFNGGAQQSNIIIEGLQLVGGSNTTNCFKRGIYFRNVTKSSVKNCIISGIDVPTGGPGDAIGIDLEDATTFVDVHDNTISFVAAGLVTDTGFRVGVLLRSPIVDAFNGQVSGTSPLTQTVTDIQVRGNHVYRGTHAYDLHNSANVTIVGNDATQQIRQLIAFATNKNLTVVGNTFTLASSTNMAFDYGNVGITITGNTCNGASGGEGNCIECYYNNDHVTIAGNTLLNFVERGIFVAYGATNFNISANTIYTADVGSIGIDVEGAPSPIYTVALFTPAVVKQITIKANRVTVPTSVATGIRILSKETGSSLDPVNVTEVFVDSNDVNYLGGYGISFIKNGGTGIFTPLLGDNNNIVGSGFADGPFGSDYNVKRTETRSAIPTNGSWAVGSLVWNTVPTLGGNLGWVCITAGLPGTWIPFGSPSKGTNFTPTWTQGSGTQPSLGNGTLTGLWGQAGSLNFIQIKWVAGSSTTFGNNATAWRFGNLPATIGSLLTVQVGIAYITQESVAGAVSVHKVQMASGETYLVIFNMLGGVVRSNSPLAWAPTDFIEIFAVFDKTT